MGHVETIDRSPFPRCFVMSLFSWILSGSTKPSPGARSEPGIAGQPTAQAYPSVDPGLPNLPVDAILEQNQDLIARIKLAYGADRESFGKELLPLIRRYAEYVHLLPATADNYYCTPGGLFRLGIHVAFYSLQSTDSQIFSGQATILKRKHLEPRWRKATFVAGLCHEVHRTLSHLVVTDREGNEWPAYIHPLAKWLDQGRVNRYYLKWVPLASEMRSLGVFAVPLIVDPTTLQYLAEGNSVIVPQMMGSISGMSSHRESSVLDQLVRRSAALVIDRDLKTSAERYGRPILGSHLERYLLDAMRRLVASEEAWKPNGPKSRVWYGPDGLFVVWPNAAGDVARLLEADQLPGIPKAPETILEILIAARVILPNNEETATHDIYPDGKKALPAVKLSSADVLFAGLSEMPEVLGRPLLVPVSIPPEPKPTSRQGDLLEALQTPAAAAQLSGAASSATVGAPVSEAPPPPASVPVPPDQPAPVISLRLKAPARLNPPVGQALASIVETMNQKTVPILARTVADGVFIPMPSMTAMSIDITTAVQALAAAEMIVVDGQTGSKTALHEFNESDVRGVVIRSEFIDGL